MPYTRQQNIRYANTTKVRRQRNASYYKKIFQMFGMSNKRDGSEDNLIIDRVPIIIEEEANVVDNSNVDNARE